MKRMVLFTQLALIVVTLKNTCYMNTCKLTSRKIVLIAFWRNVSFSFGPLANNNHYYYYFSFIFGNFVGKMILHSFYD